MNVNREKEWLEQAFNPILTYMEHSRDCNYYRADVCTCGKTATWNGFRKRMADFLDRLKLELGEEIVRDEEICNLCNHSMTDNLHGIDQNDFGFLNNGEMVHIGTCTYCKICQGCRGESK